MLFQPLWGRRKINEICLCHVTIVPLFCLCFRMVRTWVGVGSLCYFFYDLWFLCLAWYGSQSEAAVPDWEPYLGSLFSPLSCGWLFSVVCLHQTGLFCCRFVLSLCCFVFQCSLWFMKYLHHEHLPRCALVLLFFQQRTLQFIWFLRKQTFLFNHIQVLVNNMMDGHPHRTPRNIKKIQFCSMWLRSFKGWKSLSKITTPRPLEVIKIWVNISDGTISSVTGWCYV
jgi:hypothetical protein